MKNIWQIIKRFRILIIGCIMFLIMVQVFYTIPDPSKWLEARWGAGDLISFVGTIVLGIVAISQTKDANDMSKRIMQLEEKRHRLEIRPFVCIGHWEIFYKDTFELLTKPDQLYVQVCSESTDKKTLCIAIKLVNTTSNYLFVEYDGIDSVKTNQSVFPSYSYSSIENEKLSLSPGEESSIVICGNDKKLITALEQKQIRFRFILENHFGERYQEELSIWFIVYGNFDEHTGEVPGLHLRTYEYRIGKYQKDTDGKIALIWEDTTDGQT